MPAYPQKRKRKGEKKEGEGGRNQERKEGRGYRGNDIKSVSENI